MNNQQHRHTTHVILSTALSGKITGPVLLVLPTTSKLMVLLKADETLFQNKYLELATLLDWDLSTNTVGRSTILKTKINTNWRARSEQSAILTLKHHPDAGVS